MKKKIVLLGVCLILLFVIIMQEMKSKGEETASVSTQPQITLSAVEIQGISRAEAFRLVSYLYYTDEERAKIKCDVTFQDAMENEWYDEYAAAIYNAGFVNQADSANGKYYLRPLDWLNRYECNLLLKQIAESFAISLDDIYRKSEIDLSAGTVSDRIGCEQFMKLYESAAELIQDKNKLVHMDSLYILAAGEDGSIITQKGTYYGGEFSYMKQETAVNQKQTAADFIDCRMSAIVSGQRILCFREVMQEETAFPNAYLVHAMGKELTAYIEGVTRSFELQSELSEPIDQVVANLVCKNKKIIGISVKPDKLSDKVLLANEDYIELEHYGKVEYDPDFKIYKVYGDLEMEHANAILAGYNNTQFVLMDHKISAALITEPVTAANIRVMIKTNGYKSLFHESVKITCEKAFDLVYGEETKHFKAKKEVTIDPDSKYLANGRLKITAQDGKAPIQLLSVKRSQGNPAYRGVIELIAAQDGIAVINELPIEEYLYAVVPSEMPFSYGEEALKTQAVCARSYAYKQLLENNYSEYGAHVDDSASYQVYNNYAETKETIQAVKETYGQVIEYQGDVITAYYFSTSCGYISSISDVWDGERENAYLIGGFQSADGFEKKNSEKEKKGSSEGDEQEIVEVLASSQILPDFSDDMVFRKFLKEKTYSALESSFPWYRWETTLTFDQIKENIDSNLKKRYEANPALILTESQVNGEKVYQSEPISSIGKVTGIEVKERKTSGIITELVIKGTEHTILVRSEYNIRKLLSPVDTKVIRQDESVIKKLSMLPSAFFVFDPAEDGIKITGGGYGHGVGMSQNGVKALSDLGYTYDQIVGYYYKGTGLKNIYQ